MAYSPLQISSALLKSEKTIYKIGQIAYDNMFSEDDETLDYERDIIFIYKESVNYAKNVYIGEQKLDKLVEKLSAKIYAYDYGELNPVYSDAVITASAIVGTAYLNDLSDVTISNLLDNQILRYNAATGQWINVGPGNTVRNSQSFVATAGQTSFTTAYPFDIQLLDVYINGVKINSSSYSTVGEYTINLVDGCIAGDIVDVVIFDPETSILPPVNNLNDLNDVNIGPLVNKQGLYYNSVSGLWENGLVFVPYTGALGNVDLGEYEIRAGQFTLDTSPTGVATVGTTRWNDTIGSSETTLKGGSVILKNGVDLVARIVNKVSPNQTLTKAAYQAVRVSGAQGQRLAVALAQANNDNNSADTIGLVTETIATNQEGFIMTVGSLEGINTTGSLQGETWVDGDVIYLSPTTAGALTNVKPIAPQHIIIIGYVEYAHGVNGKLYVKVMNGWELGELHDVDTTGATNGQVLKYNGTIWTPSSDVGITSLNGLNATTQTFATGSSGTDFNISSATSTHTFNLPTASATNRGLLSSADWTIFNNKQNALTNPITGTGTTNYLPKFTGATTLGNSLLREGTNAIAFNIAPSDWSATLNAIQVSRTAVFSGQPGTEGMRLGSNFYFNSGFKYQMNAFATSYDQASGNHLWYTAPENTSGAGAALTFTERMRLFNNGNLLLQAGGTFTDSGQRLQVTGDTLMKGSGNTSATTGLTVQNSDSQNMLRILNNGEIRLSNLGGNAPRIFSTSDASSGTSDLNGLSLSFSSRHVTEAAAEGMFLFGGTAYTATSGTSQNVNIARTFSPTSGTAIHNTLQLRAVINQTGGANGITRGLYVNPTLTAAADWRSIEWSNNTGWGLYGAGTSNNYLAGSLGVGTTAASATNVSLMVTRQLDGSGPTAIFANGQIQSTTTIAAVYNQTQASVVNTTFTLPILRHFSATQGTIGASATVTTQVGFHVQSTLTGAINNYAFQGTIASGTNRWNIYMDGTANNYLAGSLGIGSTSLTGINLRVSKNITGATASFNVLASGAVQSDVTSAYGFYNTSSTAGASFTLNAYFHFFAEQGTFGVGSTVSSQYGFYVGASLIGATNNYGFFGNIAAATGRWNLYMAGTADNYLAGSLGIGIATPTIKLQVENNENASNGVWTRNTNSGTAASSYFTTVSNAGQINITAHSTTHSVWANTAVINTTSGFTGGLTTFVTAGNYDVWTGSSIRQRITSGGNLLIGSTTDSGEKLQVTGTAKITGTTTFGTIGSGTGLTWDNTNNRLNIGNALPTNIGNQNIVASTSIVGFSAKNTSSASGSTQAGFYVENNSGFGGQLYKTGSAYTTYKIISANDLGFYNSGGGNISILNDLVSGSIRFAAGGSSTVQWTIASDGNLEAADGKNLIFATTNGTKIGTATNQKIGFWNATPIIRPTGNILTALSTMGLVSSPTIAVGDVTGAVSALTGEVSTTGTGSLTVTLGTTAVTGKLLTGLSVTSGAITSSDSILGAFGKIQGQINALSGGSTYKGSWNANTNSPTITSGTGTAGDYYIVSTAGTTTIDGVSSWDIGDWIIFNGTVWQKIDNTDSVTSVNSQVGAVVLTTSDITEGTNLYYTDTRARAAISLTTSGSSGAATYSSGVLNIPNYTLSGLGGVSSSTTLTINGTALDLTTSRSWDVGTVTSVNASVPTGFSVGSAVTSSGNIAIGFAAGYALPTILSQSNWDVAYNDKINSASVTGTTTKTLTLTQQDGGTVTASWSDDNSVTSVFGRTGAVVATSGDYTTAQVTESGNLYFTNARAIASTLTGYTSGAGTITASDTILSAIQKLNGNIGALVTGVSSVNGLSGAVTLSTSNVSEGTNLYYTDTRARAAISLTTTGSSGAATYSGGVLNIPTYTLAGLGGVSTSRTLTINGTAFDLSADRAWSVGTVTSVNASVPTGFSVGSAVTSSGDIAISFAAGYALPTTASQANWDAAYNDKINSASVTGTTTKTLTLTQQDGGTVTASWSDIDTAPVSSVFGRTGAVVASSGDYTTAQVTESGNLYYTDARARAAISLTTTGTSGAATYSGGVLNIPQYQSVLTNPVTGTGASGRLSIWNGSTTVTSSSTLYYSDPHLYLGYLGSGAEYSLTIGQSRTGNGYAYIDLVGDSTYADYGLRIMRSNTGANTNSVLEHQGTGDFVFKTVHAAAIKFQTGATERVAISSDGQMWVGYLTSQGSYTLQVNGSTFSSNGFFETSDIRIKDIIRQHDGLDFGAIEYKWKDGRDTKTHWGYAAQDVQKVIPDAVYLNDNGFYSLDYNQAHTYKIAKLEEEIKELKKKLNALE
jgi:hypothetical protein